MTQAGQTTTYTYDRDWVSKLTWEERTYQYRYNAYGDLTAILLGNQPLMSYSYSGPSRQLSQIVYASGQRIEYTYDRFGNAINITEDGQEVYRPVFDEFGNYQYSENVSSGRRVS